MDTHLGIGKKVYYHDPDGAVSSGIYTIHSIQDVDISGEPVINLENDEGGHVQALPHELSDID